LLKRSRLLKRSDIVHVPAGVLLTKQVSKGGAKFLRYFKTTIPKKALFLEYFLNNERTCYIEYGEETWFVNTSYISLVE